MNEGKVSQCHNVVYEDQYQQRPMKTNKVWQGQPIPKSLPLSVGLYLNSFQISCDLSRICSSKTSHAPSSQDSVQKDTICLFSAKRPLTCLLQQNILSEESFQKKHDITQLSLQRNHKFPLHSSFIQTIPFLTQFQAIRA